MAGEILKGKGKGVLFFHAIAIAIIIIWGSTLVSTKVLIREGMRADEIFVLRILLAYIAVCFISPRKLWSDNWRDELMILLLGVTGGSLYFITENIAVGLTYVNNVSFIASTSPLFTMLIAIFTYKGITIRKILFAGTLLAIVGVGIIIFNGQQVLHLNPMGDFVALIAAVSFGVYCYLAKQMCERYDAVFITRKMFFYGLLTSLPLYLFEPWQFPLSQLSDVKILFNLLFLGLIASFACFVLWNVTITKIGAVTASNYLYLIPLATVLFSAIFLDETMNVIAWIGCLLIMAGVWMANVGCRDD